MKSNDIIEIKNLIKKNNFIIRWNITSLCNYYCDFCVQGDKEKHIKNSKGESEELRRKICDKIIGFIENDLKDKYKSICIYLIGGEITILPDFLDIIKKIINCKFNGIITIFITTNLSTNTEVLEELANTMKNIKKRKLSVGASYYKEFTNEKDFIEKVKVINKKIKFKSLNKIDRFEKLISLYRKLKFKFGNSKIKVNIGYPLCNDEDYAKYLEFKKRNRNYADSINYIIIKGYKTCISEDLKKKILKENNYEKCIRVKFNDGSTFYFKDTNKIALKLDGEDSFNPKGFLCDAGMHNISIDNLGNVSRCTSCRNASYICNIITDGIKLMTEEFICPSNTCGCTYFSVIRKKE